MSRRFLFTGSRSWTHVPTIESAILAHMRPGDTMVHGDADGLDLLAVDLWKPYGPVEGHRAEDFPDPLKRNLFMISLGAETCLAFALRWRSGTGHCARHARKAGIFTLDYGVDTTIEARG